MVDSLYLSVDAIDETFAVLDVLIEQGEFVGRGCLILLGFLQ